MSSEIITLILLALGFGFGVYLEKRHYKSILQREQEYLNLPAIAVRFPPPMQPPPETELVYGSVVISVDYFKRFLAGLRLLVGGRLKAYETLLDRARREAVLRMKQHAADLGGELIFNVKLETASISKGKGNAIGSVEVLAYGTAIIPAGQPVSGGVTMITQE